MKLAFHIFAVLHFQDGLIDQLYDLMLEYFHTQSHSIGFPELALPTIIQVKQLILGWFRLQSFKHGSCMGSYMD